ncbi:auxin-responsive protein SAUR71-like [Dioscorea cayenensis subsp. rotundata]|uniref:Auxin-responsive protein SAUR71-like n=1 Tax=Dioscorea cayennensis subsp. rotundata TaxID=55577 RepID=A0AB40CIK7_DIOCR|nr:auxin-responsive protein SAUR71-like [Dioscorea cayenensis subsp. rotundata]
MDHSAGKNKTISNKITEIVRLQQMLKKWKKLAVAPKSNSKKSIKFLKKTLSFSDTSSASSEMSGGHDHVPKGFLAVCVGEEMRRFVIPTEYLSHRAFELLLREAEEEFGFQQEGVLRIPCEVSFFETILKVVEKNKKGFCCCSLEAELANANHSPKPIYR